MEASRSPLPDYCWFCEERQLDRRSILIVRILLGVIALISVALTVIVIASRFCNKKKAENVAIDGSLDSNRQSDRPFSANLEQKRKVVEIEQSMQEMYKTGELP